jgi:hypothetical protein
MTKEVVCVYQDCPLCGDKGKVVVEIATAKGASIRKVSFASDEGRELIHEALFEHGIGTMPFYVMDGRFSTQIEEVLKEPEPVKKRKTTKRKGKK